MLIDKEIPTKAENVSRFFLIFFGIIGVLGMFAVVVTTSSFVDSVGNLFDETYGENLGFLYSLIFLFGLGAVAFIYFVIVFAIFSSESLLQRKIKLMRRKGEEETEKAIKILELETQLKELKTKNKKGDGDGNKSA